MVQLTETAVPKVREILDTQDPKPSWAADRGGGRGLLRVQLLDGLREYSEYA